MKDTNIHKETILKGQEFGQLLTEALAVPLQQYSNLEDRRTAAKATGISFSTVQHIILRKNKLHTSNYLAIVALVRIAIENCETSFIRAQTAVNYLSDVIAEVKSKPPVK